MQRALSIKDVLNFKSRGLEFDGCWLDSFGKPELSGCWLIWGNSGNGKTTFALQLCKYLTNFARVLYIGLEEGLSLSFQTALKNSGLDDNTRGFSFLPAETPGTLVERLKKRRSADVIVIDSIQYSGLNKDTAKALVDSNKNKLIIFISHAEGKNPAGRTAKAVRYHAHVKVWVEGYKAFPASRYGGGAEYVIWEEGASQY